MREDDETRNDTWRLSDKGNHKGAQSNECPDSSHDACRYHHWMSPTPAILRTIYATLVGEQVSPALAIRP